MEKASSEGIGDQDRILVMRIRKVTQKTSSSMHHFGTEWPETLNK